MKIFLKSDAYKSMIITNQTSAKDVCELMAEKLNIGLEISKFFEVTERVKKGDQYLGIFFTPFLSYPFLFTHAFPCHYLRKT